MFYPPEGVCESSSQGVQLNTLATLLVLERVFGVSKTPATIGLFENLILLCLQMGWDGTGYLKSPLNFILRGYIDRVYRYLYIVKSCHQHSCGFQNLIKNYYI